MIPQDLIEKFWKRVDRRGPDECWPWIGAYATYGTITHKRKLMVAHRLSWEIDNGQRMPEHLLACHVCDRCLCVNPSHIRAGTPWENAVDAVIKNRLEVTTRLGRLYREKTGCYPEGAALERWLINNGDMAREVEAQGAAEFWERPSHDEALPVLRDGVRYYSVTAKNPVGISEVRTRCIWSVYHTVHRYYSQCKRERLFDGLFCYHHYSLTLKDPDRPHCTFGPDPQKYKGFKLGASDPTLNPPLFD